MVADHLLDACEGIYTQKQLRYAESELILAVSPLLHSYFTPSDLTSILSLGVCPNLYDKEALLGFMNNVCLNDIWLHGPICSHLALSASALLIYMEAESNMKVLERLLSWLQWLAGDFTGKFFIEIEVVRKRLLSDAPMITNEPIFLRRLEKLKNRSFAILVDHMFESSPLAEQPIGETTESQ